MARHPYKLRGRNDKNRSQTSKRILLLSGLLLLLLLLFLPLLPLLIVTHMPTTRGSDGPPSMHRYVEGGGGAG